MQHDGNVCRVLQLGSTFPVGWSLGYSSNALLGCLLGQEFGPRPLCASPLPQLNPWVCVGILQLSFSRVLHYSSLCRAIQPPSPPPPTLPPLPCSARPDTSLFRDFLGSQGLASLLLNPSLALTVFAPNDLRWAIAH